MAHDCARSHEGVCTDVVTAHHHALAAEGGTPANMSLQVVPALAIPRELAARYAHVGERHRRAAEDVVFQGHPVVHVHVVLQFAVVANHCVVVDVSILSDVAGPPYDRFAAYVGVRPHLRSCTDLRPLVDHRALVYLCFVHVHHSPGALIPVEEVACVNLLACCPQSVVHPIR